jgi:hypothetical protein
MRFSEYLGQDHYTILLVDSFVLIQWARVVGLITDGRLIRFGGVETVLSEASE